MWLWQRRRVQLPTRGWVRTLVADEKQIGWDGGAKRDEASLLEFIVVVGLWERPKPRGYGDIFPTSLG